MTDRELLVLTTRALDLLDNVEPGSAAERDIWRRDVAPVLNVAREYLAALAPEARASHPAKAKETNHG